jgi:hypothetical protein
VLDAPPPHDVPAYEQARRDGLLPLVPDAPPALLAGDTADQASTRVFLWLAGAIVAFFLLVAIVPAVLAPLGLPRPAVLVPAGVTGLAMLAGIYRAWGRVGEVNLDELHHGYTTLSLISGSFWKGEARRWPGMGDRVPWDYRGVWALDNSGGVGREPDRTVLAPGLYPSPHRAGHSELWSGTVWTGSFRPPPGSRRVVRPR